MFLKTALRGDKISYNELRLIAPLNYTDPMFQVSLKTVA